MTLNSELLTALRPKGLTNVTFLVVLKKTPSVGERPLAQYYIKKLNRSPNQERL